MAGPEFEPLMPEIVVRKLFTEVFGQLLALGYFRKPPYWEFSRARNTLFFDTKLHKILKKSHVS